MKETRARFVVNAKQFLRDWMAVGLVLLLPVAFAGFLGLTFSGGGAAAFQLSMGVVSEDRGAAGEVFVQAL